MSKKNIYNIYPFQDIYLNPQNKNIVFQFDINLFKSDYDIENFKKIPDTAKKYLLYRHAPIVTSSENDVYVLIAGHMLYKSLSYYKNDKHRFLLLSDASWADVIQRADKYEHEQIESFLDKILGPSKHSASTNSRHDAIYAKQTCPKCGEAILGPMNGKPLNPNDEVKYYRVSCYNAHQHHRDGRFRCDFYADLNEYEFCRFDNLDFATGLYLAIVENGNCNKPNCDGLLYIRTFYQNDKDSFKIVECHNHNHSFQNTCDFSESYELWQPMLKLF